MASWSSSALVNGPISVPSAAHTYQVAPGECRGEAGRGGAGRRAAVRGGTCPRRIAEALALAAVGTGLPQPGQTNSRPIDSGEVRNDAWQFGQVSAMLQSSLIDAAVFAEILGGERLEKRVEQVAR